MSTNKDGGPAFPTLGQGIETEGLSMRDYFAAKAMQGLISDPQNHDPSPGSVSAWAYRHADAMLRAREAE